MSQTGLKRKGKLGDVQQPWRHAWLCAMNWPETMVVCSCMLNFRSETFPPASPCPFSLVVRRSGYWHDWSCKYKWMKLASFEGWPRSEKKEDSRVGSAIRWRWLLSASGGFSTHREGQAGEDPVPIGENTSHVVWGKPQDPPGETGKCCWVKDLDYHRNLLPPHPNQVRGG